MLHELKLDEKYCGSVYWGFKMFEVRLNDREFKVGDFVRFTAVNSDGTPIEHKINNCYYQITYVLSDFCGLAENYVAFCLERFYCYFEGCEDFSEHGFEACFDCTGAKVETNFNNRFEC